MASTLEQRTVLIAGAPILKQVAEPVSAFDQGLHDIVDELIEIMHAKHGAGLSAPQIGISQKIFVYYVKNNPRYPDAPDIPLTTIINPNITHYSQETESADEGCLSLPRLRGIVPRSTEITYNYQDLTGKHFSRTVSGFEAKVIQHEYDHLLGILFPERMTDLKTLYFYDK